MITSNVLFSNRKAHRCAARLNRIFKKYSFAAAAVTMRSNLLSPIYGVVWYVRILTFDSDGRIEKE